MENGRIVLKELNDTIWNYNIRTQQEATMIVVGYVTWKRVLETFLPNPDFDLVNNKYKGIKVYRSYDIKEGEFRVG